MTMEQEWKIIFLKDFFNVLLISEEDSCAERNWLLGFKFSEVVSFLLLSGEGFRWKVTGSFWM